MVTEAIYRRACACVQLTFKEYLVRLALPKPRANPVLGPTTSVDLSSPTTTERSPKVWLTPHELRLSLAFEALDAQGVGVVGAGDLTEVKRVPRIPREFPDASVASVRARAPSVVQIRWPVLIHAWPTSRRHREARFRLRTQSG